MIAISATNGPFRVCYLTVDRVGTRGISFENSAYGLVDHVKMFGTNNSAPQFINADGSGISAWSRAVPFGTTNAMYVEDCQFINFSQAGNGFFDQYDGSQLVFRNNYIYGYSAAGSHGYDSGDVSPRSWEIYNNTWSNITSATVIAMRGGTGYVYSNTVLGTPPTGFSVVTYYRACPASHPYPLSPTGYTPTGQPGYGYTFNFSGASAANFPTGLVTVLPGNPTNLQQVSIGFSTYTMLTNLLDANFTMYASPKVGAVKIGANTEQTISNLWYAINLINGGYGTNGVYYNSSLAGGAAQPFRIGHDFLAFGMDTTNLYCTNVLDTYSNSFGWPANQQSGVITSYPLSGSNYVGGVSFTNQQQLWPFYYWGNTIGGSPVTVAPITDNCNGYTTNFLLEGRDFFSGIVPTNYTALVYPHPLNTGSAGPPPPDEGPTISPIASQSLPFFNSGTGVIPFMITDVEDDPNTLVVTKESSDTALVPLANITLGGTGTNRNVTVNPVAGQWGSSLITLTVTDSSTNMASSSFAVSVTQPKIFNARLGFGGTVVKP